ncbi:MAG: Glu-tRNA(Gln) amidotransferase subunit GatE [Halobacteriales archaeon]|nr:Glu-tRNA(Gln) amidotransferase subunit GatE [Halobacteriales archaeon]
MARDWKQLGLKVGLEIHQQLDTPKLFCRCPSALEDEHRVAFTRRLRPTQSELGEVDPAALAEAAKKLGFRYLAGHATSCLVEMDEEPPHRIAAEAVEVGLQFALLTGMQPVDELHTMRKLVIDGSNTTGFQRTAMLAMRGQVGEVGLDTLCLEEDSARPVEKKTGEVTYRLDRLGIPLLEVATAPDIKTPEQARQVAEHLGMVLRSTGRVRRGLGTIRQDLNVSIAGGARVEIKGVQQLDLLATAVEREVERQLKMLEVRAQLQARPGSDAVAKMPLEDLTSRFQATKAGIVQGALKANGVVLALKLPGFAGLIGTKAQGWPRLGAELADYARVAAGVKGIFHSDELPGYGITEAEVADARAVLACQEHDAFVLVACPRGQAERALEAVRSRAWKALQGVPEETRDMLEDGTSQYSRPLPGRARMYPETDVPPLPLPAARIAEARQRLPELLPAREARMAKEYSVGKDEVHTLVRAGDGPLFERLVKELGKEQDKLVARVLLQTLPELDKLVPEAHHRVGEAMLLDALLAVKQGVYAKEALPRVLQEMAERGGSARDAARRIGLGAMGEEQVRQAVRSLLDRQAKLVQERGERAMGPLMGDAMAELRGKADGQLISKVVREELLARLGPS